MRLFASFRLTPFVAALLACQPVLLTAQNAAQQAVIQTVHSAQAAMQRGDLVQAETLFRQAVTAAPDLSSSYLGLGLVQLRLGKGDEAVKTLSRGAELNPQLPGVELFLGIALFQTGDPERAAEALKHATAAAPDNVEALTWLGIVQLGRGHAEDAVMPLDHAARLSPKNVQVLYYDGRAHMLLAAAAYQQLSALDPDSALVHRGMAESFEVAGQTDKAIAEYEAAISKDAANEELYEALGDANLKISRVDAAKAAYTHALALHPGSAVALYNLGRLDVEHGNSAAGVAELRKAMAAHGSVAPVSFYLGLGLAETGQNAEAVQWFERSLAAGPSPFIEQGDLFQLGRVYQKLNRKEEAHQALARLQLMLDQQQAEKNATSERLARAVTDPGLPSAAVPAAVPDAPAPDPGVAAPKS